MDGKKWYLSKTLWFNALSLLVLIASAFGFANFQMSPEVEQVGAVLVVIINLVLRFFTKQSLSR